jgi:fucose permease
MSEQKASQDRFGLFVIACYSFFVIGALPGLLNIAWTYMQITFSVSFDSLGILLTAFTTGRLLIAFGSGRLINSYGIGRFLVAGSVIGALGVLGMVVAPSFALLLVAGVIASVGSGIIDTGMNGFASSYYGHGRMNWLHAFFGVGLTVGPQVVTLTVITLGIGWQLAYTLIIALFLVLTALLVLTFSGWRLPPIDANEAATDDAPAGAATIGESLRYWPVLLSMALFALYGGVEIGTGQLLNTLFVEGRGITQEVASFWISIYWGSFTVGRMIVGSIGARLSNMTLLRLSTIGALLGMLLLWLNLTEWLGFAGVALVGFALAPMFASLIAETPRRVGRRHVPNAIGFQIGVAGLGAALLAGVAAFLAEQFSPAVIAPFLAGNAAAVLILHEFMLLRESRRAGAAEGVQHA